jgi:hypothetical protein
MRISTPLRLALIEVRLWASRLVEEEKKAVELAQREDGCRCRRTHLYSCPTNINTNLAQLESERLPVYRFMS